MGKFFQAVAVLLIWTIPSGTDPGVNLVADINGDTVISMDDFFVIADQFGQTCSGAGCTALTADINGDTVVNMDDFFFFADAFDQTIHPLLQPPKDPTANLNIIFSCSKDNDLYQVVTENFGPQKRYTTPLQAINSAPNGSGVLILANTYPTKGVYVAAELFELAESKNLRLYIEYPNYLPEISIGAVQKAVFERAVITSDFFGMDLKRGRIATIHGAHFYETAATEPLMVMAKVAGYDTTSEGLPTTNVFPILFKHPRREILVSTTKLSQFVRGRYGPYRAWQSILARLLSELSSNDNLPLLEWVPTIQPSLSPTHLLPANSEMNAFVRGTDWFTKSRILVHDSWLDKWEQAGRYPSLAPAPDLDYPNGDGSLGILEGFGSSIDSNGKQMGRYMLRADGAAESAMAMAFRSDYEKTKLHSEFPNGLVGLWRFEEGSGTKITDSSSNSNEANLNGATWEKGAQGNFSANIGGQGYVAISGNALATLDEESTFTFWMKSNADINTNGYIASAIHNGWMLSVLANRSHIEIGIGGAPGYRSYDKIYYQWPNETDHIKKWVHVACTKNSKTGQMLLYIDGVMVAAKNNAHEKLRGSSVSKFRLGSHPYLFLHYNGSVDEFGVYNRALSELEVKSLIGGTHERRIAINLLDWLYNTSNLFKGDHLKPKNSPSYGMLGFLNRDNYDGVFHGNDLYFGDENARTILSSIIASATLKTDRWNKQIVRALMANMRTQGTNGYRPLIISDGFLEQVGFYYFHNREFPAEEQSHYLWAAYLWAYQQTGDRRFLDRTKIGISKFFETYPVHRGFSRRMMLPLSWLVRIENSAQNREWLMRIVSDILVAQDSSGAIRRVLPLGFKVSTNANYGTGETLIIQQDTDPAADLLYVNNFAFLGLHEAYAATGDPYYADAADKLAKFLIRIQTNSQDPQLDGVWLRGFDFKKWEYWASAADNNWGPWSIEAAWTQTWITAVFYARHKKTSMWELMTNHMDIRNDWRDPTLIGP